MWFRIKSYLLFLVKSTNQHGVHSPFVYDLVTKCFYHKTNSSKTKLINKAKHWLHNNKISTTPNFSTKKATLLIRIFAYYKPLTVLEIGTSVGLGTTLISIGNSKAKIITLEECNSKASIAKDLFQKLNLENIKLTVGNFEKTLPFILNKKQFDIIYFNGIHKRESIVEYFNLCLQSIHNNSIFVFNEINRSTEIQQAWLTIKEHPRVIISIDTFYLGIIFFRKEQQKQHFTIRV
jgi:predicted O-methyltransferase YrrM